MKTMELFWDVGSPYTYLAVKQVEQRWSEAGEQVVLRPFLVGGVFKSIGNTMPASVPAKALYMMQDLRRWAEKVGVPLVLPGEGTPFPINTLIPMRGAVVAASAGKAREYCGALFDSYWGQGRDVSDLEVLKEVVEGVGLEWERFSPELMNQSVKDSLRANTEEAVERGAFGAPAIFVGESHYWGNDRVDMAIEELLRGD